MLVVESQGLPMGGLVASAQQPEVKLAEPTLATVKVPRPSGRPRTRCKEVVADKAYDGCFLRIRLRRRGIKTCKVDRTYAWWGNYRRLVVRHEWLAHIYLASVMVAFIMICLAALLK